MEERRLNWVQILMTAIVTGIVTIITGMILYKLQQKEPRLVYAVSDTAPFHGTGRNFAIYNVSFWNNGNVAILDVTGVIRIPFAKLEEIRISRDPALKIVHEKTAVDTLTFGAAQLNPEEKVSIAIFATSKKDLAGRPEVDLRGSGVRGAPSTAPAKGGIIEVLVAAILAAYAGLASVLVMRRTGFLSFLSGRAHDNQNEVMAYICGVHGLMKDVEEYLTRPRRSYCWAEADRQAALATINPKTDEAELRKKVLRDLLEYASVQRSSKGIIHYNIARIAAAQGNKDEVRDSLALAKKFAGALITARLKIEPHLKELIT